MNKIGSGSYGVCPFPLCIHSLTLAGDIYAAVDLLSGENVAIKMEFHSTRFFQLEHEYRMYKSLGSDILGVPEVKWFGTDNDSRIMVMQLLGPSLETVFQSCNQHFSLTTVLVIADELVSGLTNF